MNVYDKQVGGTHYMGYDYQPVQFFMDTGLSYPLASAIKYLARIGVEKDKGNIGIDKAIHYLEMFQDYWVKQDVYTLTEYSKVLPEYSKVKEHVQSFVNQFEPDIADIILAVVMLHSGLQFCEYDSLYPYPVINPDSLEAAVQAVIKKLENIKE